MDYCLTNQSAIYIQTFSDHLKTNDQKVIIILTAHIISS